jgi:hypothetical protein
MRWTDQDVLVSSLAYANIGSSLSSSAIACVRAVPSPVSVALTGCEATTYVKPAGRSLLHSGASTPVS